MNLKEQIKNSNFNNNLDNVVTLEEIKNNLATNIVRLRKRANITQLELAELLNYSDKAVSKWERGEAVPDITVLKRISDIFKVSIDTLIATPKQEIDVKKFFNDHKRRSIICSASAILVWLVAVITYSFMNMIYPPLVEKAWLVFIVAIPITFTVVLIFTSIWGKNLLNLIFASLLCWTLIATVYLFLINFLIAVSPYLWMIYLIGIPIQILLILRFTLKRYK